MICAPLSSLHDLRLCLPLDSIRFQKHKSYLNGMLHIPGARLWRVGCNLRLLDLQPSPVFLSAASLFQATGRHLQLEANGQTPQRLDIWNKSICASPMDYPSLLRQRRRLCIIFATVEEIEAEKGLIEEDAMERMEKTVESVKSNFNTIRTGRASPSLLDRIEVEYYGSLVILKSIAQISTPDGSTILVQPFDKSSLSSIERAIMKSDTGLTPSSDGNVIRLSIPQLTAERRKELLKLVSKLSEEGKVAIRNVRRDALKAYEKLEKEKKISEDNLKDLSVEMQKLTDDYVKKIDAVYKQKEKELTTV